VTVPATSSAQAGPTGTPALVAALHRWGDEVRRDLPWRRTRDPWAVLVSELMLQQTQVSRVVDRFDDFLARFPAPAAMAAVPLADVLDAWAGLGYYRRARALHAAACSITATHAGRVPDDLAALVSLPGIGAYTARAVLAFAFERDHGVIDTNAARVLSRAFAGAPLTATVGQRLADSLVPPTRAWAHNQSMLDLGATVCTARAPRCDACPLATGCIWHTAGRPDPDPARTTAGTSRPQPRFEGSDRQLRGRVLTALRSGDVLRTELSEVTGIDDEQRRDAITAALVAEGLAEWYRDGHALRSPGRATSRVTSRATP
jgi:A/G-specific adenine glycosylase